jgi:dTDP-4-dehydrorhamnose 3,5-epimerase
MFKSSKTRLKGVLLIYPYVFKDFRGQFVGTYDEKLYRKKGIKIKFVEDDISVSKKNILRGIHADSKAWKLVSCISGEILAIIVNCNEKSKNFGKWQKFLLSESDKKQILIPPKYGCGHLVLSKQAIFTYKQSEYYDPRRQSTYLWNDPRFKIKWPIKNPILSERDKTGRYVNK